MNYQTLELTQTGGTLTIWMNRPEVFNAFNETLIQDLSNACEQINRDDSVRTVILAGRGKHFSAGADLNWMKRAAQASEAENFADAKKFARMLNALSELEKPTIARVHGAALGGGTGLVAACDMAIACDDSSFSTSEVKFGIIPAVISPYVLRAIGPRQALRYFQSGERFDAARALALGLVNEVVAAADLDAKIGELNDHLQSCGPKAQVAAKSLIRAVAHRPIDQTTIDETAKRIAAIRVTPEAKARISAFLDKQPAR